MLKVHSLNKVISNRPILSGLDFEINPGSITGLIGENGAGKTTLLKSICGILRPTSGEIVFNDSNVFSNPEIRHDIAFVTEEAEYFKYARVEELLNWYSEIYDHFDTDHFNHLNLKFQIPLDTKVQKLSKGMRMKVSLMLGLSIRPKLLLLDEPTTGLDPASRHHLFEILMGEVASNNTTIIVSSHLLNDLEQICDHIIMLKNGSIINHTSLDHLKSSVKQIQVCFNGTIPDGLADITQVIKLKIIGRVAYLTITGNTDTVIEELSSMDILFWESINMKLEDIFITTNEAGETDVKNIQTSAV